MGEHMNSLRHLARIGLTALVAVSTCVCMELSSPAPARAAADGVAVPKFIDITAKATALNAKIDQEIAKLQAVDALLKEIDALHAEIETMSSEIDADRASAGEEQAAALAALQDATTVFNDQIAGILDPEVVKQVALNLQTLTTQAQAIGTFFDGSTEDITSFTVQTRDAFGNLQSSLDQLKLRSTEASVALHRMLLPTMPPPPK